MKCRYKYDADSEDTNIECTNADDGTSKDDPIEADCIICHIKDNTNVLKKILSFILKLP